MVTVDEAVDWVNSYKGAILKKAKEYAKYAPYDVEDYLQDAYEAAAQAAICCRNNPKLKFEGTFWSFYCRAVGAVTPYNTEWKSEEATVNGKVVDINSKKKKRRCGEFSQSLPSVNRVDIELELFPSKNAPRKKHDLEALVATYGATWSEREKTVMGLALGITGAGCLSNYEIAEVLKIERDTVREYLERAIKKAARVAKAA